MSRIKSSGVLFLAAVAHSSMANAGSVYYGKYYAVYDLEIAETYDIAKQCVLKQIFDKKLGYGWIDATKKGAQPIFASPDNLVSRFKNVKGRQIETIEFGKYIGLKIEVDKGDGVTRFIIRGNGVNQGALGERPAKYAGIFQPCFDYSKGSVSSRLKEPLKLEEGDRDLSFDSDLSPSEIVGCLENFPKNVHYMNYLSTLTPQVTYNSDGSFLIGWKNSGSMLTGPSTVYLNVHYVENIAGKSRLSIGYVGGRVEGQKGDAIRQNWYADLAQSCAKDGTSKKTPAPQTGRTNW